MAKLPPIKRLLREDFADAPAWMDRLLYPLNQFLDAIYNAMNRGLTVDDNILTQTKTIQIVAGAAATNNTFSFLVTMKAKPRWIILTATPSTGDNIAPSFNWNYDGANINITSISSLTNGTTYDVSTLVL